MFFSESGSPAPHGLIRCPPNLDRQTSMHCSVFMVNICDAVTAGREAGVLVGGGTISLSEVCDR